MKSELRQKNYNKILAFYGMGGWGPSVPMRSTIIRRNINWKQFIEQFIVPDLDWGIRRVFLHLPFGKVGTGMMDFDSYIHAKKLKLTLLTKDFVRSMKSLIRGKYTSGEKVQVICYLGSLGLEPHFQNLKPYTWIKRFKDSLRPFLLSGCDIALDTAAVWKPTDAAYAGALMLKNLGIKVYIEGTEYGYIWKPGGNISGQELIFHGHWDGFNWTSNQVHAYNNILDTNHGGKRNPENHRWAQPDNMGEGIMMINGHAYKATPELVKEFGPWNPNGTTIVNTFHKWAPDMVRKNLKFGYSSAVLVAHLKDHMTIKELVT